MILLLPPVFDGEALLGYGVRVQALQSGDSFRAVTKALFGSPVRRVDWALPDNLADFSSVAAPLTNGVNPSHWIRNHTLFPYFSNVATSEKQKALEARMLVRRVGPVRPVHAISAGELAYGLARHCPSCAAADEETTGIAFIHTYHLLPYVTRCQLHGCRLLVLKARSSELGSGKDSSHLKESEETGAAIRFARESCRLLTGGESNLPTFLEGLGRTGWWANGKLKQKRNLKHLIKQTWTGQFDDRYLHDLTQTDWGITRLLNCFEPRRGVLHPVAAVLVRMACEFTSPLGPLSANSILKTSTRPAFQARMSEALALLDAGRNLTRAAKVSGVSITSLAVAAKASGRSVASRPKSLTDAISKRLTQRLEQGDAPAVIAKEEKTSLSSVYRLRAVLANLGELASTAKQGRIDEHRTTWLAHLGECHDQPLKMARQRAPAVYAWLYRNDREWLALQTASRGQPRVAALHKRRRHRIDVSPLVVDAAQMLQAELGRPERLSVARVVRTAGLASVSLPRLAEHKPGIRNIFDTGQSFVKRRKDWAESLLVREGAEPVPWKVMKIAGLRTETWEAAGLDRDTQVSALRKD